MKVVLRDDVENIGRKGDLIEVTDGFARGTSSYRAAWR